MQDEYDFFSGFEGNDELIIEVKNKNKIVKKKIRIWIGYINEIFSNISPNDEGFLDGVALIYNTEIGGWYENDSWELCDVKVFYDQIKRLEKKNISLTSRKINKILLNFADFAIKNDYFLYLSLK